MAMIAQPSALPGLPGPAALPCAQFSVPHLGCRRFSRFQFSRFHATRQRAEQNLACSRFGSNVVPQRAHCLLSAIWSCYAYHQGLPRKRDRTSLEHQVAGG
jgi:hypothetical protein